MHVKQYGSSTFFTKTFWSLRNHTNPFLLTRSEDKKAKAEEDEVSRGESWLMKLPCGQAVKIHVFSVSQSKTPKTASLWRVKLDVSRWNILSIINKLKTVKMQLEQIKGQQQICTNIHSFIIFFLWWLCWDWFFRATWQRRFSCSVTTLGQTKKLLKQLSKEEMGQGMTAWSMNQLQIWRIWSFWILSTWCKSHQKECFLVWFVAPVATGSWNKSSASASLTIWQVKRRKVKGDTRPVAESLLFHTERTYETFEIAGNSYQLVQVLVINRKKSYNIKLSVFLSGFFLCTAVSHVWYTMTFLWKGPKAVLEKWREQAEKRQQEEWGTSLFQRALLIDWIGFDWIGLDW